MIDVIERQSESLAADVRSYFERSAESFDRLYHENAQSPFWRWINRTYRSDIVLRFLQTCQHVEKSQPKSVLDVGCGSGRYLAAFAKLNVERMVGIDLSQPMLNLAREQVRLAGHQNTELICANFDAFETKERFDIVVAMGYFDYQSDAVRVLKRMRALCNHSVVASFPSRHWLRTPLRQVRYRMKNCPVFFYDRETITATAELAGFSSVETLKLPGAGMDYVSVLRVQQQSAV